MCDNFNVLMLSSLVFTVILAVVVFGYWVYNHMNRCNGAKDNYIDTEVREPETWPAKKSALEEKYGLMSREIYFSHYRDDVSENVYLFDDSETLLLMGQPVEYKRIERATLEFAGVYVIKIWVEGLEGHYLTLSSSNAYAAHRLHKELELILK